MRVRRNWLEGMVGGRTGMFGTTDEHRLTLMKTDKDKKRRSSHSAVGPQPKLASAAKAASMNLVTAALKPAPPSGIEIEVSRDSACGAMSFFNAKQ
jgi:hypothetical protein